MPTVKVTRYKRTGGWFLAEKHLGEYHPQSSKEHDDLIVDLLNKYSNQPDVKVYGPGHVIYKDIDSLLAWRPEDPKDQLIFNLVCPEGDIRTWRVIQCYHDNLWYYLTRTWGYDGFNDGFYLSWGVKKINFAPKDQCSEQEGWLHNYQIDALLKEAREEHKKDLHKIPRQSWKQIPLTWQKKSQANGS